MAPADDDGGGALNRGVDGLALPLARSDGLLERICGYGRRGRTGSVTYPFSRRISCGGVDVVRDAGEALEILLDEGGRLFAADAEAVGQPRRPRCRR